MYPHAASVVLFGLSKTLKYKQKPGRDVAALRSELLLLIGFVEDLATRARRRCDVAECPQWAASG